jgi:hypothetical protein
MRVTPRKDKTGQIYYSFDYTDSKSNKRIRLKKYEAPFFTDRQQAEAWANSQTAYQEALKAANARRTAWKKQHYDFVELSKGYVEYQKEQAPNSWERAPHCLNKYVLYWFLDVKKASNINVWQPALPRV